MSRFCPLQEWAATHRKLSPAFHTGSRKRSGDKVVPFLEPQFAVMMMYFTFNSVPVLVAVTRINSQELFVVTHGWKNEMQTFHVLIDNSGNHYWLIARITHITLSSWSWQSPCTEAQSPWRRCYYYPQLQKKRVRLWANNKIAQDYIGLNIRTEIVTQVSETLEPVFLSSIINSPKIHIIYIWKSTSTRIDIDTDLIR